MSKKGILKVDYRAKYSTKAYEKAHASHLQDPGCLHTSRTYETRWMLAQQLENNLAWKINTLIRK